MKHLGKSIPRKGRKLLIEGHVISKLRYLISIWGYSTVRVLSNVQTLQNDAARFILNIRHRRTSTIILMREQEWITIEEMRNHSTLQQMWKIINLEAPRSIFEKSNH